MDNDKKQIDKREIYAILIMAFLFIVIHGIALLITGTFQEEGMQAFEDPDNPINIVYILFIMLIFTAIILLIAKFWKKQLIQIIILGAIGYTSSYVFYPLFNIILPNSINIAIPINENSSILLSVSIIISFILALSLVIILYKFPEWYVIDICGIIIGAGAIAIFGISLGIFLVIILLISLAIYDAISVYKTKHMIDLADTVMDLKLPVLLVVPKIRKYSLIKETKRLKEKLEEGSEREAFFMGLGDIVMPGILVVSTYNNISNSLPIVLSVIIGTLIGFVFLMNYVIKGKPQAGLPFLCGGAILGYIISSLVLYGELKGLIL
jgi:presenilin-like A22 family membrane protease